MYVCLCLRENQLSDHLVLKNFHQTVVGVACRVRLSLGRRRGRKARWVVHMHLLLSVHVQVHIRIAKMLILVK